MKMTPVFLIVGSLLVFWASMFLMVLMPALGFRPEPSEIWRPFTEKEKAGQKLFVGNGCSYCHSRYIRINDWGLGAQRIAQAGDYVGQQPVLLGTERIGPDLSQAGGEHPDDWHRAHFAKPRHTRPISLMPVWEFLGEQRIDSLIAFVQAQGLKDADARVARQIEWGAQAQAAFQRGHDANIEWLHEHVPPSWRAMPNPYPATDEALARGLKIYQDSCIGCHGPVGDGQGSAAPYLDPPALNFTLLRRHLVEGRYIGGLLYYQIMNGVTGTAMPYFKRELESEKIWDVSNYVAVTFIGYTDANIEPSGIDAAYEPRWTNTYPLPGEQRKLAP
jgi:cbb3-type cytochrome c oxidase subunit II